ncbi:zinc metalloprotease HtpX [Candidatus Peregrinibacteria bacterium CG_4_10_14_0_2_um_filter_43_11]|nr:MAG: zinc metalloprotease HtpX [Candidatus Peregrinibacteria bacterium CG_4_10_14_0_2_um_filter_43_11]
MYNQITQNKRNTSILLITFVLFFGLFGYTYGYVQGGTQEAGIGALGIFGIIAIIYAMVSYYSSGKLTLAIAHAKEIEKKDHFELFTTVENLTITAGIPTPKIYLIDDTALNAFATGRDPNHAAVAITKGLLDQLNKSELQGVMAHELSHIKNYDIRLQSITVALIGLIAMLSDVFLRSMFYGGQRRSRNNGKGGGILILVGFALAILSPIIAKIMNLAISRQREYLADASGAMLTRYPEGLARALEKIAADTEPLEVANKATAHLYIENPLRNEQGMKWMNSLFSTHPDVRERIKRLRGMNR